MKIYIAATFATRDSPRMCDIQQLLLQNGHEITSRWITQVDPHVRTSEFMRMCAEEDFEDIRKADALLLLCDGPSRGKHIEFGYAYALGKQIYVIGDQNIESVFFHLPGVLRYRFHQKWEGLHE